MVRIEFTRAARKHRIGRARVRYVLANSDPAPITTTRGEPGWLYVGDDDRGVTLEVIAVLLEDEETLLVVHVMPTWFREGGTQ